MPGSQGLKLNKSQKVYSPEILEANAIDAGNINAAYPWLARLNYYADESGSKYWKKRVKDIYDLYGFDYCWRSTCFGSFKERFRAVVTIFIK